MHPILQSRAVLAAYLALWSGLAVLILTLLLLPGELDWQEALFLTAPLCAFYAFVCLIPWYLCRTLPLGSTSGFRLAVQHLGAAILATAVWIGIARGVGLILDLRKRLDTDIPQLVTLGLLLYLLSVALHYVLLAVEASREAALQARDAELRALKSQINPHFLFNCLNSISALTTSDPAKARVMCVRLSDFLRNTLGLGERESIPWQDELDLARTYLEVEQVRFGSRLQVEMDVDADCADCQVPALVLQPLIENAIKHGIASMVEGGVVKVSSRLENGVLMITVENTFDPEAPSPRRSGVGLRNVRSRLETRFGRAAHIQAESTGSHFRAEMAFPCQKVN